MTIEKPYGEILDDMDHQAKYQPATVDPHRGQELRIQALGAAISRRDWHTTERAYEAIRDKFYDRPASPPEQPAAASLERLPVEKLARHFRVSVAQAKAAQDDIGFMYRELAVPAAAPFQPHENCNCLMCIAEKPRDES